MRNTLLIICITVLFTSCGNVESNQPPQPTPVKNPDGAYLQKTFQLVDSAIIYMQMGEAKKISKKKANAFINPIMSRMDSISKLMTADGQAKLKEYRIRRINELIDEKVQNQ